MRNIELDDSDAAQVKAIMSMHAEMQDNRAIETMTTMGRLKRDDPHDAADTILDLEDIVEDCEIDAENLKRIASKF